MLRSDVLFILFHKDIHVINNYLQADSFSMRRRQRSIISPSLLPPSLPPSLALALALPSLVFTISFVRAGRPSTTRRSASASSA